MAGESLGILIFIIFLLIIVSIVALSIFLLVFWILMIIDCAKRNFKTDNEKIVWILVIVFTNWLGALIYYFVVKKAAEEEIKGSKK